MVSYSFQGGKRLWTTKYEAENSIIKTQAHAAAAVPELYSIELATNDSDSEKWSVTQIIRLLRFYGAHPCLWDLKCEDNSNRKMRRAALIDITAAMGDDLTNEQVLHKINVIRATYRYEKKRIKQRIRRGLGARTKLKWFAVADAFLRGIPKKSQKNEEPLNSDSDLEDVVIFTINPEALGPLEMKCGLNELEKSPEKREILLEPKLETFSDDSQSIFNSGPNENADEYSNTHDSFNPLKKPKLEDIEKEMQDQLKEYNDIKSAIVDDERMTLLEEDQKDLKICQEILVSSNDQHNILTNSQVWTLESSFQLIELLKAHPILCESNMDALKKINIAAALKNIAEVMKKPVKSIEKRCDILKVIYEEEKLKIMKNAEYKPCYKWWNEFEKLMEPYATIKTESIYLEEKKDTEASTEFDYSYENLFQNPIPSVAPMSNMNEAMAALFHEDSSLDSNATNSPKLLEIEKSQVSNFVWAGVEDDLLEGKWSLKHSVKFLRLYGAHRCLWDLSDPDYRSRSLRNAAIDDIAASMGYGLTGTYVAKKIKIFRITYMQQRKRILESIERGESPEVLLKWFPLADSFLRPHIGLRSIKSDAKEMPQFDFQYVYANLNLIDPTLLNDFRGKGTQNAIDIGNDEALGSDVEK